MSHIHKRSILAFLFIPSAIILFLFGIFLIVWLRSGVRTVEYGIASLDNQRQEVLKERKSLMAERASLLSMQSVKNTGEGKLGLVFPDRVRVIYVKRDGNSVPYKASLKERRLSGS